MGVRTEGVWEVRHDGPPRYDTIRYDTMSCDGRHGSSSSKGKGSERFNSDEWTIKSHSVLLLLLSSVSLSVGQLVPSRRHTQIPT
jgi:hypothetical protein